MQNVVKHLLTGGSETRTTPKAIKTAVEAAIRGTEKFKSDIRAGDQRLREIRQYLEKMDSVPEARDNIQIGSPDLIQTFPSFDSWLASFSATTAQEKEDEFLLRNFKQNQLVTAQCASCEVVPLW